MQKPSRARCRDPRKGGCSRSSVANYFRRNPQRAERLGENRNLAGDTRLLCADAQLVQSCLDGNEAAWVTLIDKYKNLIYSIPVRWGFSQDDATDVFQSVAAQLLTELRRLRDSECSAECVE